MSQVSEIEWTDATWNPTTGCRKVSPGCKNCYAEKFAERFRGIPGHHFEQGFDLRLWRDRIDLPLTWKTPKKIFVNSMSDLFIEDISDEFIGQVFQTMESAHWHIFQVLTKRPQRLKEWAKTFYSKKSMNWPSNIWMGVSVESQPFLKRVEALKGVPSKVKFISFEPLLGAINFDETNLKGIDWAIVGGESGHYARRMEKKWIESIRMECKKNDVAFFFKQWGAFNSVGEKVGKGKAGRIYKGKTWNEYPVSDDIKSNKLVAA
jgi:protein gp37